METVTSEFRSKVLYKINYSKIFHKIHSGLGVFPIVFQIFQYKFSVEQLRVPGSISSNKAPLTETFACKTMYFNRFTYLRNGKT